MRDYPAVSNVFRINSSSSILLDDHYQHHQHPAQPQHFHQQQHKLLASSKSSSGYEHRHFSNGGINYQLQHNNTTSAGGGCNNDIQTSNVYVTTNDNNNAIIGCDNNDIDEGRNSCSFIDAITSISGNNVSNSVTDNNNGYHSVINSNAFLRDDKYVGTKLSPIVASPTINGAFMPRRNNYALWISTPVAASFAVAIVIASIAGPQWLLTKEKIPNPNYNGTANFNVLDEGVYVTKHTKSSLWILCASQGLDYYCSTIDYFPNEEYSPDPNDSTMAIPYAITRATPFFLLSGIVLLISYIVLMVAMCSQRHSIYFFTSGILFIISGLLMLIGLIMYISIFKAEIGSKLRSRYPQQPPMFEFSYGESFFLYVIGFISTEFVGVLNVFLFISLQQIGREKTTPCFMYARTTPEKVTDLDTNFKHFHHNGIQQQQQQQLLHQQQQQQQGFNCKKHSALPNGYFSPFTQRRYFFEKSQNCDVHANKNLAKSLNELYTEPAPLTSPFDLPQEFPLTRSVSTTTEIFSNNNTNNTNNNGSSSRTVSSNQLCGESRGKSSSRDSLNKICGLTKSILSTKKTKSEDELFNEFCQRAGYRPKPKDIYVIESDPREKEKSVIIVDNYATLRKSSCNRRNSSCAPNNHNNNSNNRKSNMFNSNSSLNNSKSYPKNMFDVENGGGSFSGSCGDGRYLNNQIDNNTYFERNNSRDRSLYHSRTLPRDFLKRNVEFADHLAVERRVSASGIYRSTAAQNQYDDYYKKSYDTLASRNSRHRDAYSGGEDSVSVHWPNAIPGSPSSFSSRSQQYRIRSGNLYPPSLPPGQQIPSPSSSSYYSQHQLHADNQQTQSESSARSQSPSGESGEDFGTFDLDKIENERRKSHANLFQIDFDYDTGTAV